MQKLEKRNVTSFTSFHVSGGVLAS